MAEARYLLDENMSGVLRDSMRRFGIDVVSVAEVARRGFEDGDQLRWAAAERRVVLTHDADFVELGSTLGDHAGVGYCHQQKYRMRVGALVERVHQLHLQLSAEDWHGRIVFL